MLTIRSALLRAQSWLGFGGGPACAVAGSVGLPPDLVEEIVAPRYGIDGWTYQGTVLEEVFPSETEAELAALTHSVCSGLATAWGYERAARLLERGRAFGQAYAVVLAYGESGLAGASGESGTSGAADEAALAKWRARLARAVLAEAADRPGGHGD